MKNSRFKLLHNTPHSPDSAPCDFYLFPKLKEYSRRCKFTNDKDVICTTGRPRTKVFLQLNPYSVLWRNAGTGAYSICYKKLCWKVTKYGEYLLWLTVLGYELFEWSQYIGVCMSLICCLMLKLYWPHTCQMDTASYTHKKCQHFPFTAIYTPLLPCNWAALRNEATASS